MTNEGDVKKEIKKLLDAHGWFWWMPGANGYGTQGVSDFCAVKEGWFMAIEAKFGDNKPTVLQRKFLCDIMSHESIALVVNEKNLSAFEVYLSQLEGGRCDPHPDLYIW